MYDDDFYQKNYNYPKKNKDIELDFVKFKKLPYPGQVIRFLFRNFVSSFKYLSGFSLIISNLLIAFGVFYFKWDFEVIIILYWLESIVIAFYGIIKMILVKNVFKPVEKFAKDSSFLKLLLFLGCNPITQENLKKNFIKIKVVVISAHIILFSIAIIFELAFLNIMVLEMFREIPYGLFEMITSLFTTPVILGLLFLFVSHGFSFQNNYIRKKEYEKTSLYTLFYLPFVRVYMVHFGMLFFLFFGFIIYHFDYIFNQSEGLRFLPLVSLIIGKIIMDLSLHVTDRELNK